MTADLPAAPALERPCRPCQDDDHDLCSQPSGPVVPGFGELVGWCCCDGLDRDPGPAEVARP